MAKILFGRPQFFLHATTSSCQILKGHHGDNTNSGPPSPVVVVVGDSPVVGGGSPSSEHIFRIVSFLMTGIL